MPLKLKDEYKKTIVAFNKSGKPLGERDDLHVLYEMSSRNKGILKYFSEVPTKDELNAQKEEAGKKLLDKVNNNDENEG